MAAVTFLGIFYVLLLVGLIVLYFNDTIQKDIWLQGLILLVIVTVFINMIPFVLYQTNFDLNVPLQVETVVLDGVDLNDLSLDSENFTNFKVYHLSRFNVVNNKGVNDIVKVEVCLFLNNTDASNIVYIGGISDEILVHISPSLFIPAISSGWFCSIIDKSIFINQEWIGFHCDDCAGGNTISYERVNNAAFNVTEFEGTEGQPLTNGNIVFENPHAIKVNLFELPSGLINKNFYRLLFFIGIFALIFIMRMIYNITRDGVDYG